MSAASTPAAAATVGKKASRASPSPNRGRVSTFAASFVPSLTLRFMWMARLGMTSRSRSTLHSLCARPFSVRTTSLPATESGRSIHVDMIMPPYFSVFRRT